CFSTFCVSDVLSWLCFDPDAVKDFSVVCSLVLEEGFLFVFVAFVSIGFASALRSGTCATKMTFVASSLTEGNLVRSLPCISNNQRKA
ncbi:MAG: hypothetical protein ABJI00_18050, partial [Paracoccaceae bacterium]